MKILYDRMWYEGDNKYKQINIVKFPNITLQFQIDIHCTPNTTESDAKAAVFVWYKPLCIWRNVLISLPLKILNPIAVPERLEGFWKPWFEDMAQLVTQIIDEIE